MERTGCRLSFQVQVVACGHFHHDLPSTPFHRPFPQLVSEHMGHCHQLCIKEADVRDVVRALTHITQQLTPILNSIHLHISDEDFANHEELDPRRSFPFGFTFPHLTIAQLDNNIFPFLSAFRSVVSLRLTEVCVPNLTIRHTPRYEMV